jgi:hypothetical protein
LTQYQGSIWHSAISDEPFPTPDSGFPELLFDEGYCTFKSFYQRTVRADTTTDSNIITYDDKELIAFEDTDDAINVLFMLHESILLKDAKGTTSEVTYLGSQLLDKVLLHKVRNTNGHEFLVDGNLLSSMDTPDIRTILVSIEHYVAELPKITREQLEQISNPWILDDDQQVLKWAYIASWIISLIQLWLLLPKRESWTRNSLGPSIDCQFARPAFLVHVIANHGIQRAWKVRSRRKLMMHQASVWA